MKKLKSLVILAMLLLSCVSVLAATPETTIVAIGDAGTYEGSPDDNYGGLSTDVIQSYPDGDEIGFILFNASKFTGDIPDLTFSFHVWSSSTDYEGFNLSISYCNDAFDEDTITWNNQDTEVINCVTTPVFNADLNTTILSSSVGRRTFFYLPLPDLDTYIENDTDKIFTLKLMILPSDDANNPYIEYLSTEEGTPTTLSYNPSASVYESDAFGFHVFEEFDSTHNPSMWGEQTSNSSCWTVEQPNRGYLRFFGNSCTGTKFGGYLLNNSNYTMLMADEFNLTIFSRNAYYGVTSYYSGVQPNWQERTDTFMDNAHNQEYYSIYLSPAYLDAEYLALDDHIDKSSGVPVFSPTATSPFYNWREWSLKKHNNANDTFYIEVYADGVFMDNISSEHDFALPYNIHNWTKKMYFSFIGFEHIFTTQYNYEVDSFELNVTYATPINIAPTIVINSPANETHTNIQAPVIFNATDVENATLSCSLYIDTVLNATNSSVVNNTETTYNPVWTDGIHQWFVGCSDGQYQTNSAIRIFNFDNSTLFIQSAPPSSLNSTIFTGYSMSIVGNVTNTDIGLVNRTIRYPNSTVFYHNSSGALPINTSIYSWSDTFNTTPMPNGIYSLYIYAVDNGAIHNSSASMTFQIQNCIPDWSCTGFSACNISDEQTCNSVVDLNTCGQAYTGDYTEFGDFTCNYCSRDIVLLNETACSEHSKTVCYLDNNFATCCNVTGIGSDCYGDVPQSEDTVCALVSCSMFTYSENDITGAVINLIGKGFVTLSILAGLIAIIGVGLWAYNRFKMGGFR